MPQLTKERKQSFSSFNFKDACKYLGITQLERWVIEAEPVPISDFFRERLARLKEVFDLENFKVSNIYGIVTNGEGWKFYRLTTKGEVAETRTSGANEMPILLGRLRAFFKMCEQNLD